MNKALIYARVSTEEQARQGQSIEAQVKICRQYAKDKKIGIASNGVYKDEGRSGSNINRPALQQLIDRIEEDEEIDFVLVQDTDRLARNTLDHLTLKAFFKKQNVQLVSISQPMIDDSPEGQFMDTILAGVNAFYSNITARKTSKVMEEKIKAGWWPLPALMGYLNSKNPSPTSNLDKKIITPDPNKAELVKLLFEMYASGTYSIDTLTKKMTSLGLTANQGNVLHKSLVARTLSNPFYYGAIIWKGKLYNGKHEPLISRELFNTCQDIMNSNNQNASRKRKHNFLLRGFIYDADTKDRFWAEQHKKPNGNTYTYYFNKNNKKGTYVSTEELEKQVEKWFGKVMMTEEYANDLREEAKKVLSNLRATNDEEKRLFINQKTAIQQKIQRVEDNLLDGTISKERFQAIVDRLDNELLEVQEQIDKVTKDYSKGFERIERLIDMARNIQQTYVEASPEMKREYLALFFEKFFVRNGKIIEAIPSQELRPLIKNGKISVRVKTNWLPD